jgi:hypothetical protein
VDEFDIGREARSRECSSAPGIGRECELHFALRAVNEVVRGAINDDVRAEMRNCSAN